MRATQQLVMDGGAWSMRARIGPGGCVAEVTAARLPVPPRTAQSTGVRVRIRASKESHCKELSTAHRRRHLALPAQPRIRATAKLRGGPPVILATPSAPSTAEPILVIPAGHSHRFRGSGWGQMFAPSRPVARSALVRNSVCPECSVTCCFMRGDHSCQLTRPSCPGRTNRRRSCVRAPAVSPIRARGAWRIFGVVSLCKDWP